MFYPGPTEPMSSEGWKVLGCLLLAFGGAIAGIGLWGCLRFGFSHALALRVFLGGIGAILLTFVARWAARRWGG